MCVYLSTGERVLSPITEYRPGRCEAEPLQQCQLRPRFQCPTELLCCDRYNLIHATLIPERMHAGAALKDIRKTKVVSPEKRIAEQCLLCPIGFLKKTFSVSFHQAGSTIF